MHKLNMGQLAWVKLGSKIIVLEAIDAYLVAANCRQLEFGYSCGDQYLRRLEEDITPTRSPLYTVGYCIPAFDAN